VPSPPIAEVFVARVSADVSGEVFAIAARLRAAGIAASMDHQGRSLKSQFKLADRLGARLVVVVGPDEVSAGEVVFHYMGSAIEERVALGSVADSVSERLGRV
jgi:histidyl-tRNA synthetase